MSIAESYIISNIHKCYQQGMGTVMSELHSLGKDQGSNLW